MLVIGRRHHYRIDAGLRQQVVVVHVGLGVRRGLQRILQVGLVDLGDRDALGAQLLEVAL